MALDIVDIASLDFNEMWIFVKELVWEMFKFPFLLFHALPTPIKAGILAILLVISCLLIVWTKKNKESWRQLFY